MILPFHPQNLDPSLVGVTLPTIVQQDMDFQDERSTESSSLLISWIYYNHEPTAIPITNMYILKPISKKGEEWISTNLYNRPYINKRKF